jgi:hypothetical protein
LEPPQSPPPEQDKSTEPEFGVRVVEVAEVLRSSPQRPRSRALEGALGSQSRRVYRVRTAPVFLPTRPPPDPR